MKMRLAWLVACVAVTMVAAGSTAVKAQPIYYPGASAVLPPYEILTIVRSVGLEPLGRPVRSGKPTACARSTRRARWFRSPFMRGWEESCGSPPSPAPPG